MVEALRTAALIAFYAALALLSFLAIKAVLGPEGGAAALRALGRIEARDIAASCLAVIGVFATLWGMEQMALKRAGAPRAARARTVASLVANAVSLGAGFGMLSGGALRARLYAPAGVDAPTAFYVASAVTLMSLLGGALIATIGLIFMPGETLTGASWRGVGVAGLCGFGAILVIAGRKGQALTLFGRRVELPGALELSSWIGLGALDWLFSAAALFVLLPAQDRLAFPEFAALFALAHLIAMPTGSPGGLGVFDAIMVSAAGDGAPPSQTAAALIVYRVLCLLAPVALGFIGLAMLEATRGRGPRMAQANARKAVRPPSGSGIVMHGVLQFFTGQRRATGISAITKGELFAQAAAAPPLSLAALTGGGPILILAPHPDDDVLGCGGLIGACSAAGIAVHVVYLTDGRRSHLGSRLWPARRLAEERRTEAIGAGHVLGLDPSDLTFLANRDGVLLFNAKARRRTVAELERIVAERTITCVLAPWIHDPHPDHAAAALIARQLRKRHQALRFVSYPIWGCFLPADVVLRDQPWRALRLDVRNQLDAKRLALAAHRTQATALITDALVALPAPALETFLTGDEFFFTDPAAQSCPNTRYGAEPPLTTPSQAQDRLHPTGPTE